MAVPKPGSADWGTSWLPWQRGRGRRCDRGRNRDRGRSRDRASLGAGRALPSISCRRSPTALVDPDEYVFPNNNRRRIPGYLYLAIALGLIALVLVRGGDAVFVNRGFLGAAAILGLFGVYSIITGWDLAVDERDALDRSIAEVGFPVGHASAQMGWRGLLSRPTWRILLYSADEPPTKRAFVMVDGVEASIVDSFVEDNPEDWSDLVPADS